MSRRSAPYETLAKAWTQAGCMMHPSTPVKMEKGNPPCRITVNEFVAFAKVLGFTLDQLLVPPDQRSRKKTSSRSWRSTKMSCETGSPR